MTGSTKVCTGPAHTGPTRLPLSDFHIHKSGYSRGQPLARCKLCVNWRKLVEKTGPHGYIEVGRPFVRLSGELLDRCGNPSAVQRLHGIHPVTLHRLTTETTPVRVQKRTALRILAALAEQRKNDRRNGLSERFLAIRREQARREGIIERQAGY